MRILLILSLLHFSSASFAQNYTAKNFSELETLLNSKSDSLYVINFWATWCKPCLEELPYFEEVTQQYKDEKLQVILVSVDSEKYWESALTPFLKRNPMQSKVWALYNAKPQNWIDNISPQWSGAIPATIFLYQGEKYLFEKEFTFEELNQQISTFIKS